MLRAIASTLGNLRCRRQQVNLAPHGSAGSEPKRIQQCRRYGWTDRL